MKKLRDNKQEEIEKEILLCNYWEHIKFEKDLAFVLGSDHPRCLALRKLANEMSEKLHEITNDKKKQKK